MLLAVLTHALLLVLLLNTTPTGATIGTRDDLHTVAFWPIDIDATLTHARATDGTVHVSSSNNGVFGTFSTALRAPTKTPLHPLVESIEIAWVAPVNASAASSTFEELFAPSSRLVAVHSVGLHIQVTPTSAAASATAFVNASARDTVEASVRRVLHDLFPSARSLPVLQPGFLAASLCNSHGWRSADPMHEALEPSTDATTAALCLASAFAFPSAGDDAGAAAMLASSRLPTFARTNLDGATTAAALDGTERSITEQFFDHSLVDFAAEPRLTHVRVTRDRESSVSASTQLAVDILETWIASGTNTGDSSASHLTWHRGRDASAAQYLVVTAVQRESIAIFSSRTAASRVVARRGGDDAGDRLPASRVNVSVIGDGFHRRVAVDADVRGIDERACSKLLLRVPLSHEVYADLDELRRMERFGELRLLAFAKHIEIERPSPVSPQHSIALEFPLSSPLLYMSFPIHFRYQAPSATALFRAAPVIAPELLLLCESPVSTTHAQHSVGSSDHHPRTAAAAELLSQQDAAYFEWILTSSSSSPPLHASRMRWRRLRMQYPARVCDVQTPVGVLPHGALVSIATLAVASLGALLLVGVSLSSSRSAGQIATNARDSNWIPESLASSSSS